MSMPVATSFRAHLKPSGDGQLLKDHLFNVSAITSRLAVKAGMPRAGALIGLAHDLCKYLRLQSLVLFAIFSLVAYLGAQSQRAKKDLLSSLVRC